MTTLIFVAVLIGLIAMRARSAARSRGGSHSENFPFPSMPDSDPADGRDGRYANVFDPFESQGSGRGSMPFPSESSLDMPSEVPSSGSLWRGSVGEIASNSVPGDLQYNSEGEYVAPVSRGIRVPLQAAVSSAESELQPQLSEPTPVAVDSSARQGNNLKLEDFDLRTAVIYREILDPKYDQY